MAMMDNLYLYGMIVAHHRCGTNWGAEKISLLSLICFLQDFKWYNTGGAVKED